MDEKIRELYKEFNDKSEIFAKWHGSFTSKYIKKLFEEKFGKEFFNDANVSNDTRKK